MSLFTPLFRSAFLLLLMAAWAPSHAAKPDEIMCINVTGIEVAADTCSRSTGQITLVHDGTAPFTYTWSQDTALNDSVATGLAGGTYTVSISDAAGCEATETVVVPDFSPLELVGRTDPDTCGAPNGSATVEVLNPGQVTPPFIFQWDSLANNQTTSVATGLTAGNYTVIATDDAGCQASLTLTVRTETNGFAASVQGEDARCFGDSTGSATVSVSGGNGAFLYEWRPAGSTNIISTDTTASNLSLGTYLVIASDALGDGCAIELNVTINQPEPVIAGFGIEPSSACRELDGFAFAEPTGGTAPYTYLWSTGETNDTLSNVPPGAYTLTVIDTFGCEDSRTVVLTSTTGPFFDVEILQEDNCGLGEGIARVNITQGNAPYAITWWVTRSQAPDTTQPQTYAYSVFRTTGSDPYSAIVVDADTCINKVDFFMPGHEPLEVTDISSDDNYCGLANGTATVSIAGGTLPYTYQWTTAPVQTEATATGLIGGMYEVAVRDSFNCDISAQVEVINSRGFEVAVTTTDESCYGQEDGTAIAVVSGARGGLSASWDTEPPTNGLQATDLPAGVYTVTVTDGEGCTRTQFGEVGSASFVEANFVSQPDSNTTMVLSSNGITFANRSEGADSYLWDFGDGNVSTERNPTHIYADTGTYFVTLIAYNNQLACADTVEAGPYRITLDGTLQIPNAFSPNADGFNDNFIVRGDLVEDYQIRIFNRWGRQVFLGQAVGEPWNGTLPGGKPAPQGVYVYHVSAIVAGGKEVNTTGTIILFR
ncbi:MAG: PKD domain-containing protein [Bacteroidetes bacterium]|nr:MAG: PKD domain-containing protein [Bacteroidota bacterium]